MKIPGRRRPYTEIGIGRVPCARCGVPSVHQWQCCAIDNRWLPLCLGCDIGLNRAALEFVGEPAVDDLMARYEAKSGAPGRAVKDAKPPYPEERQEAITRAVEKVFAERRAA